MPNWIGTKIEISGTRDVLETIEKAINQCNDGPAPDNGSDNNWVGNIFDLLHINKKKWNTNRVFWHYYFVKAKSCLFEDKR